MLEVGWWAYEGRPMRDIACNYPWLRARLLGFRHSFGSPATTPFHIFVSPLPHVSFVLAIPPPYHFFLALPYRALQKNQLFFSSFCRLAVAHNYTVAYITDSVSERWRLNEYVQSHSLWSRWLPIISVKKKMRTASSCALKIPMVITINQPSGSKLEILAAGMAEFKCTRNMDTSTDQEALAVLYKKKKGK